MPRSIEDLDGHLIVFGDDTPLPSPTINWPMQLRVADHPIEPVLRVNNIYGMYRAVASGLGVASLPSYMARLSSELVHVLPDLVGPEADMYFVYCAQRCIPACHQCFIHEADALKYIRCECL